jgi:uncharacterized protein (DUF2252 family)
MTNTLAEVAMPMTLSPDTVVVPPLGGAPDAPSDTIVEHRPPIAHLTPAERVARGKAARLEVPLASHAVSTDDGMRRDPVDILVQQGNDRVTDLLPIRYGRMLASPFAFYRGSAAVMAADLAGTPTSGLHAQLCGDAHLANFGLYATPERRLVFDINDFDETLPGPFEWDVKRLAASISVAGQANGHHRRERRATVRATVRAYRQAIRAFAGQSDLAVWYAKVDAEQLVRDLAPRMSAQTRKRTKAGLRRAHTRDNADALRKLTTTVDGRVQFINDPPLIVPLADLLTGVDAAAAEQGLRDVLRAYRSTLPEDRRHLIEQFRLVDLARKVVGVGSVGTRAYVLLMLGRDSDPLILQAKQAQTSVLEPYCGRSRYANAGHRVVAGQRLIQAASDIFLGWQHADEGSGARHDYYVRQLRDGKASADIEDMNPRTLSVYGELCGWTLARAHARSGDRIAIAAYLGKSDTFDRAVTDFAESYAERTITDHSMLGAAATDGRIPVLSEV